MNLSVKTIVFDLGGVLIDYDLERCFASFRKLGFPQIEELVNPYKQSGYFLRLEQGSATREEFYAYLQEEIGRPVESQKIDEAWCSFLLDIPEYKLDMLIDLRRRGFQLLMLSNTNTIMFEWMAQKVFTQQGLTVDDYFDRLFLSYQMKLVKPDAAIFHQMARQAEIDPAQTLFIDDGAQNIKMAQQLGFHTYQPAVREDFRSLFEGVSPLR